MDNSIYGFGNYNDISNGKIGGVHNDTTLNGGGSGVDLARFPNATQNIKDNSIKGFGDHNNISGGKIGGVHSNNTVNADGSVKDKEIAALKEELKAAKDQLKAVQDDASKAAKVAEAKIKELEAQLREHGNCDAEKLALLEKIKAMQKVADEAAKEAAAKLDEANKATADAIKDLKAANDAANDLKIKIIELQLIIEKLRTDQTPVRPSPTVPPPTVLFFLSAARSFLTLALRFQGFQLATTIPDGRYRIINKATGFHLTAGIVLANGIPHNNYIWTYNPCPDYGWYIDPELCIFTVKNLANGHEIINNRLITRYIQPQGAAGVPLVGSASTAVRILTVPNDSGCFYLAISYDSSPFVIANAMAATFGPKAHHVTISARAGSDPQQMWRFERVN
ncbi:hypothetical protein MVEN_01974200 [Mycena venus]|uniref:Uncharacterized protein n=1 Tax=Mycena venus TaxID=2733690 RepID=A0A8H7CIR4_9AGAR|nr:hypothetical protein MVEN_01974200 [Mycena venus]